MEPAGPCQPDRLEPNDDEASATVVEPGIITWLRLCDNDDYDVFTVELEALQPTGFFEFVDPRPFD